MSAGDERMSLDELTEAVQTFAVATNGDVLVTSAVVLFEVVRLDDAGDHLNALRYAVAGPSASMAASIGLAHAGVSMITADALDDDDDDGDEL